MYKSIKDGAPVNIREQSQSGDLIEVANSTFDIGRQVAQANPQMGPIEQKDNAVQGGFENGKRIRPSEVIWLPIQWPETGRVSKLAIWDDGIGMNHHELETYTDMSSSGKIQGIGDNFGRGEIISCLGANPLGLVWLSCKDGNVNMVKLIGEKKKDGLYNWIREYGYEGGEKDDFTKSQTVIRLFDKETGFKSEDFELLENQYPKLFDTSRNFTLKVNLGHHEDQNTCENPFNGFTNSQTTAPTNWLPKTMFLKYWDINQQFNDDEPIIRFYEGTHTKGGTLNFSSYLKSITAQVKLNPTLAIHEVEKVTTPKGDIKIHYIADRKIKNLDKTDVPEDHKDYKKDKTGKQTTHSSSMQVDWTCWSGVVFKGKIYSLRQGASHKSAMKYFSIPANQEDFKIMVELPDDYPVYSDGDRETIKYEQQESDPDKSWKQVELTDFGFEIVDNTPENIQKLIDDASDSLDSMEKIQSEIDKYFRSLLSTRNGKSATSTDIEKRKKKIQRSQNNKKAPIVGAGGTRKPKQKRKKPITNDDFIDNNLKTPKIIPLTSKQLVKEQELQNFAAQYEPEAKGPGYIYINMLYEQYTKCIDEVISNIGIERLDEATADRLTKDWSAELQEQYVLTICKSIIRGLWHKNKGKWDNDSVDRAMTPEALSLMAEQLFDDRKVSRFTKRYKSKVDVLKGEKSDNSTSTVDQDKWGRNGVGFPEDSSLTAHEKKIDKLLKAEVNA
jgi:hypothetical protein